MNNNIKFEDIPEELVSIATFMGLDMFIAFIEEFGGSHIYFPSKKNMQRSNRNKEIVKRYNGLNSKELAKEFDISEIYLKSIIRKSK